MLKKYCLRCRTFKYKHYFGINRERKDGLNIYCKQCIIDKCKEIKAKKNESSTGHFDVHQENNKDAVKHVDH